MWIGDWPSYPGAQPRVIIAINKVGEKFNPLIAGTCAQQHPAVSASGSVQQGLSAAYEIVAFLNHRLAADKRYSLGASMHSPAKRHSVEAVEKWLERKLPSEYVKFLLSHNECVIGSQVLLYAAESLIERNETFETKIYCPDYIAVGDDSGGRAIVIPLDKPLDKVYLVDHGSMLSDDFEPLPQSFHVWLAGGCPV